MNSFRQEEIMDQREKEKYSRFFLISAFYNIIAAFNGMVFFEVMNKLLYGFKTKIQYGVTTFILRTFYTHVLVFGLGYYIVSRDPSKNHGIVWMGMLAKIVFFFVAIPYFLKKKITALTFLLAFGDLVFGVLFGLFLMNTRNECRVENRTA
jgi:hypothetical protein